jgi:hypothetical protein
MLRRLSVGGRMSDELEVLLPSDEVSEMVYGCGTRRQANPP